MDIGIIGTGAVGSALASGWAAAGHDVVLGSRTPDSTAADGTRVQVRGQREAAAFGDVVVLALPAGAVTDVATYLENELAEKPVVDTTNEYPFASDDRSLAVRLAETVPQARVVKAFNTVGAERLADPVVDGQPATMFLAGDDLRACDVVAGLARDLGFDPLRAGDVDAAEHLEHLARFWISLSQTYGRDIAFRLLEE
ncbi:NADPH-dependent F420 reductase [Halomicroarcula sp. GCM10025817]|uniref:NADPH-dependent F420 reductase n=1 Tax=Haloarcula TaxID=2237 RepID=UPI0023E85E49|nr:NAD(P)-binding domain-containing protein [Halomicroarcula sp. SYNS111]